MARGKPQQGAVMKVEQRFESTHDKHATGSITEFRRFASRAMMRLGATGVVFFALVATLVFASSAQAATAVGLGTADSFAVLAGQGVTNTGATVVNGDLGTSPNPAVTGFGGPPNGTVNGAIHAADALAGQAQSDLTTAYNNAAGQGPPNAVATELGGSTLTPGVYTSGTFGITAGAGPLVLDAVGDPAAVFIFQTPATLITGVASQVQLINGAQSCNVFWQIGTSATLGTSSTFIGNILALQSIQLANGVTVDGRLLARNASVTLLDDTITRAQCAIGSGGGGGGGGGGSGGGGGTGGGGSGGSGGGKPNVQILGVPGAGPNGGGARRGAPCVDRGFRAKVSIHDKSRRMRKVEVRLDGELIKRTTRKQFSFFVSVAGLRAGRNTIRVLAVDRDGNRRVESSSFGRCSSASPSPSFTG
jgi:hypothetical protein